MQDGKIKVEVSERQRGSAVVFTGGENANMTIFDDKNKKYMVMDQKKVEAIAGQVNQAMTQMKEALKNVPEAQRAMVEGMMKERMKDFEQQAAQPKKDVKKTGGGDTVNQYPCATYEVWSEGKKDSELCLAPWSKVEGGKEVEATFSEMVTFFEALMESFSEVMPGGMGSPGMLSEGWAYMADLEGFPVRVREFDSGGQLKSESVLRSAKAQTFKKEEFEPGPDYSPQQMPGGPQGF